MRRWLPPVLLWLMCAGLWLAVAVDRTAADGEEITVVKADSGTPVSVDTETIPVEEPLHAAASSVSCINVNLAGVEQLDALPGVGPVIARRIVEYRTANGPFKRLEDMERVKGIGPATVKKIGNRVCF
ncbi:MAG: ComEA family DNA-binding protein [Chitinispirillaceae bacterium]|nr:ComEA family DNA-binding protein [Chitinispirillaceae bacterium]